MDEPQNPFVEKYKGSFMRLKKAFFWHSLLNLESVKTMRKAILLFCIVALLSFGQLNVLACRCIKMPNLTLKQRVERDLKRADIVFTGMVSEVNKDDVIFTNIFKIDSYWKGSPTGEIILFSYLSTCDFRFKSGEKYLVFAYWSKNVLTTDNCMGNIINPDNSEQLKVLGKGKKIKKANHQFNFSKRTVFATRNEMMSEDYVTVY